MFGCVCVVSSTESFLIVCFRSEAVVWIYIDSMGCIVNGNIPVPHSNIGSIWTVTRSHGGYKPFFSCRILFGQLEIGAMPG